MPLPQFFCGVLIIYGGLFFKELLAVWNSFSGWLLASLVLVPMAVILSLKDVEAFCPLGIMNSGVAYLT